jgi:hypothetical protein
LASLFAVMLASAFASDEAPQLVIPPPVWHPASPAITPEASVHIYVLPAGQVRVVEAGLVNVSAERAASAGHAPSRV